MQARISFYSPIIKLIQDIESDDPWTRSQATVALATRGKPGIESLVTLLQQNDPETRRQAARSLRALGRLALPTLLDLARGDDLVLRIEAVRILGTSGLRTPDVNNTLLYNLQSEEEKLASRAAGALGMPGNQRAFYALLTALRHPSPDVRYEACQSLARLGELAAIPTLVDLAREDWSRTNWGTTVAQSAIKAIMNFNPKGGINASSK